MKEKKKLNFDLSFLDDAQNIKDKINIPSNNLKNPTNTKNNVPIVNKSNNNVKNALIVLCILFITIPCFMWAINNYQKEKKITKLENKIYNYFGTKNINVLKTDAIKNDEVFNPDRYLFEANLKELSELTGKSENLLMDLLQSKYSIEKETVITNLAKAYENNSSNFENLKNINLPIFFNNDITIFNKTIDGKLGYKALTLVEKKMPENGMIKNYTGKKLLVPFEISTADDNYFIKLVDYYTDKTAVTIFAKAGTTLEIDIPVGSYKIKYASGANWYGLDDLFGHKTVYSKSNLQMDFIYDGDYARGHSLRLYKSSNGNFSTSSMNAIDF